MGYRLGIDLGTTFTAAAYVEDETPKMLELGYRHVSVPSVILVADDGRLLIGEAAERRAAAEPERVIREFKRRFGDEVPVLVAGRSFQPVELQTALLRWVLDFAERRLSPPQHRAVITHPADWGPYKMTLIREVVAAAGIPDASLCPEPVAAAIEFSAKRGVPVGAKIAVYDLGGGTFDVAVLEKTPSGFAILGSPLGIQHLGGSDFDEMVFAQTVERLDVHDADLDDPDVARALDALRRECIAAKEALSTDVSTEISSLLPGAMRTVRLTRGEFEGLIRPALQDTLESTVRALQLAEVTPSDLHGVVLVGGSSRIPLVTELLTRELGVPVVLDTYPKNDIALGAARFALDDQPAAADPSGSKQGTTRPSSGTTTSQTAPQPPEEPAGPAAGAHARSTGSSSTGSSATASEVGDELPTIGAAGVTPGTSPGATSVELLSDDEPPPPSRRRRLLVGGAIGLVVIVLAIGVGVVINQVRSTSATPAPAGGAASSTVEASNDPAAFGLPVGQPASPDQLFVPRTDAAGASSQLWLVDSTRPGEARQLDAPSDGNIFSIGLSPDRRTITYADGTANVIRTMAAAGGGSRRLFPSPDGCGKIRHASWSAVDLDTFVLECQVGDGPKRLVVVDMEGKIVREIATGLRIAADPTISPDGRSVAFWGSDEIDGRDSSLYVVPIDGSRLPTVVVPEASGDPAWSPDGQQLAFRRQIGGRDSTDSDVLVVNLADKSTRTLVTGPSDDEKPSWSPDGTSLAIVSNRAPDGTPTDQRELWRVPAAGGEPVSLGIPTHQISTPTWSRR